jgi:hypothetical protein
MPPSAEGVPVTFAAYLGELMGVGRHPSLATCRRVRFDVPGREGKPRFRLIYINYPTDGAPAECRWRRGWNRGDH